MSGKVDVAQQKDREGEAYKKCGLIEVLIFIAAVVCGTACSICSKTMMRLSGVGMTGQVEIFGKPLFQTFGMFVGMMFGLVAHEIVLFFRIPFPGYFFPSECKTLLGDKRTCQMEQGGAKSANKMIQHTELPIRMYFYVAVPAVFDLISTALGDIGLQYVDVSIYQMLRGCVIVFVALMKQHLLRDRLCKFQWLGVTFIACSVVLVGTTAMLNSSTDSHQGMQSGKTLLGVLLVTTSGIVQAFQYVFEEKIMTMNIPSPPLWMIGMEGLWGSVLCLGFVYPLAYSLPGSDHGSFESPLNTWHMLWKSSTIQFTFVVYFFTIFCFNLFATLVTYTLNSVWKAILDNFRPITVWGTDLFIYYFVVLSGTFGEPWRQWSFLQLMGMFVLFYGTAVYNAPNAGSIQLKGRWYHFGLDYSNEYRIIEEQLKEEKLHAEHRTHEDTFKKKPSSSFDWASIFSHFALLAKNTGWCSMAKLKMWNVTSGFFICAALILYLGSCYSVSILGDANMEAFRILYQNPIVQGALVLSVVVHAYTMASLYQARKKAVPSKIN